MTQENNEYREFFNEEDQTSRLQMQSEYRVRQLLERLHPDAKPSDLYISAAKVASAARQAVAFEQADSCVELPVRPLIRYYAVLDWVKTLLYLHDLSFPSSTSVLQHGISVRRSKRQPYRWPLETVFVHKDGVLQSLFALKRGRDGEGSELPQRIIIGDLLGTLPALMSDVASLHRPFQHVYPVQQEVGEGRRQEYVSRTIAANAGKTVEEWKEAYVQAYVDATGQSGGDGAAAGSGTIREAVPGQTSDPPGLLMLPVSCGGHPWAVAHGKDRYLLDSPQLPQWLSHFVILYSLSALCRYNPLEWSDIVTWNNEVDAFLVRAYLEHYPVEHITSMLFACVGL
jgi:hypothetical protein